MSWNKCTCIITLIALVFPGCKESTKQGPVPLSKFIIEAEELKKIIEHDSIMVLDLRKPEQFAAGHIPTSINIWRSEIQSDSFPYMGMIGEKHLLESVLGSKGIPSKQFLVMYDDKGACEAARLWWMLNYYGYDKMAILNGGLSAWEKVGSLTNEVNQRAKVTFKLPNTIRHETLIKAEDLMKAHKLVTLIDTRTESEFSGEELKSGALLRGRIPGSIHQDWMSAVDPVSNKFKSISALDSIYTTIIDSTDASVVIYCHSGVRSAHTFFVLSELLGYENVRNFDGSWVEWTHLDLPVERDSVEVIQ